MNVYHEVRGSHEESGGDTHAVTQCEQDVLCVQCVQLPNHPKEEGRGNFFLAIGEMTFQQQAEESW